MSQWLQLGRQLRAALRRERRGDAHVMQLAVAVEQTEQKRADAFAVLVHSVASDHAVGSAPVLHLDQGPLVGCVRVGDALGDHTVQPCALELDEPSLRNDRVRRGRAQVDRRVHPGELFDEQRVPRGQRLVHQVAIAEREKVERNERGGRLRGQATHSRLGRVDPLQQRIEIQPVVVQRRQHDLAVDHTPLRQLGKQWGDQFGEVAGERSFVATGQLDGVAIAKHDAPKAVPLRLVQPAITLGNAVSQFGQHRRERRGNRECHPPMMPAGPSRV